MTNLQLDSTNTDVFVSHKNSILHYDLTLLNAIIWQGKRKGNGPKRTQRHRYRTGRNGHGRYWEIMSPWVRETASLLKTPHA